jgi:ribosomal protein L20
MALETYRAMTGDLSESEVPISKQILADIAVFETAARESDGSVTFGVEALTIEE